MSSESRHRGPHPADRDLFSWQTQPVLQQAVTDLAWLLSRGYARPSSLKLVGDRYALTERQRLAVGRAACSDAHLEHRRHACLEPVQMQGRDGCIRDMSSVHGSYHAVAETDLAIRMVAERLQALGVHTARWLLDSPVSNSGRLAQRLRELAEEHRWPRTVETVFSPDAVLKQPSEAVVISSDGIILDHARQWYNLAADLVLVRQTAATWLMDLSGA